MNRIDIWFFDVNEEKKLTEVYLPLIPISGQYIRFYYEDFCYEKKVEKVLIETNEKGCFDCIELNFT